MDRRAKAFCLTKALAIFLLVTEEGETKKCFPLLHLFKSCAIILVLSDVNKNKFIYYARVAQLVEHDLAKVGVAGSSPVSRSLKALYLQGFLFFVLHSIKMFYDFLRKNRVVIRYFLLF